MNIRSQRVWLTVALTSFGALAQAQGGGLHVDPEVWPRWQTRASIVLPASSGSALRPGLDSSWDGDPAALRPGLSLMSDYYLSGPLLGAREAGGLRASGGVFVGPRAARWIGPGTASATRLGAFSLDRRVFGSASRPLTGSRDVANDAAPAPYLGLGYTGLSTSGRWGYSADLGLMAGARDGVRLGRGLSGAQALDDAIRDMRWSPVLQLGVSYSF